MTALYQILSIAILLLGVLRGIKLGALGQIDSLLGLGFGITAARLLHQPVTEIIMQRWPGLGNPADAEFLPQALAVAFLFFFFYFIMALTGPLFMKLLSSLTGGIVNVMLGVIIGIVKYTMILSLLFNIIIGIDANSQLLRGAAADDGNISEGVLLLAPALNGTQNFKDYWHELQMAEAAKIS